MPEPTIPTVTLILGAGFCLLGTLFLVGAGDQRRRRRRALPARGVVVSATFEEGYQQPTVRFPDAAGEWHTAQCSQGRHSWRRAYYPGQELDLIYDPVKPTWIVVQGHSRTTPVMALAGAVGVLIGLGLLALSAAARG